LCKRERERERERREQHAATSDVQETYTLHLYSASIAPPLFSLGTGKGGRERGKREEA